MGQTRQLEYEQYQDENLDGAATASTQSEGSDASNSARQEATGLTPGPSDSKSLDTSLSTDMALTLYLGDFEGDFSAFGASYMRSREMPYTEADFLNAVRTVTDDSQVEAAAQNIPPNILALEGIASALSNYQGADHEVLALVKSAACATGRRLHAVQVLLDKQREALTPEEQALWNSLNEVNRADLTRLVQITANLAGYSGELNLADEQLSLQASQDALNGMTMDMALDWCEGRVGEIRSNKYTNFFRPEISDQQEQMFVWLKGYFTKRLGTEKTANDPLYAKHAMRFASIMSTGTIAEYFVSAELKDADLAAGILEGVMGCDKMAIAYAEKVNGEKHPLKEEIQKLSDTLVAPIEESELDPKQKEALISNLGSLADGLDSLGSEELGQRYGALLQIKYALRSEEISKNEMETFLSVVCRKFLENATTELGALLRSGDLEAIQRDTATVFSPEQIAAYNQWKDLKGVDLFDVSAEGIEDLKLVQKMLLAMLFGYVGGLAGAGLVPEASSALTLLLNLTTSTGTNVLIFGQTPSAETLSQDGLAILVSRLSGGSTPLARATLDWLNSSGTDLMLTGLMTPEQLTPENIESILAMNAVFAGMGAGLEARGKKSELGEASKTHTHLNPRQIETMTQLHRLEAGCDFLRWINKEWEKWSHENGRMTSTILSGPEGYITFDPDIYFRNGSIDKDILLGLLSGEARLLEIGSGDGRFVEFLISLGVPSSQVTLSDINLAHLPGELKKDAIGFDYTDDWPDMSGKKFDTIAFNKSLVGLFTKYDLGRFDHSEFVPSANASHVFPQFLDEWVKVLVSSEKYLAEGGLITITAEQVQACHTIDVNWIDQMNTRLKECGLIMLGATYEDQFTCMKVRRLSDTNGIQMDTSQVRVEELLFPLAPHSTEELVTMLQKESSDLTLTPEQKNDLISMIASYGVQPTDLNGMRNVTIFTNASLVDFLNQIGFSSVRGNGDMLNVPLADHIYFGENLNKHLEESINLDAVVNDLKPFFKRLNTNGQLHLNEDASAALSPYKAAIQKLLPTDITLTTGPRSQIAFKKIEPTLGSNMEAISEKIDAILSGE